MITVTRTLQADVPEALRSICKAMGFVRADIWRRYGALGTVGQSANDIRKEISAARCKRLANPPISPLPTTTD